MLNSNKFPKMIFWVPGLAIAAVLTTLLAAQKGIGQKPVFLPRIGGLPTLGKPSIPMNLSFQVRPTGSIADVDIQLKPEESVHRANLRLLLPEGLTLREGALEVQYGALQAGQSVLHRIQVEGSSIGSFRIQAAVDAIFDDGTEGSRVVLIPVQGVSGLSRNGVSVASVTSAKVKNAGEAEGAQKAGTMLSNGIISLPASE